MWTLLVSFVDFKAALWNKTIYRKLAEEKRVINRRGEREMK